MAESLSIDFNCACFVAMVRYFDSDPTHVIGRFSVPAPLRALSAVSTDGGTAAVGVLPTIVAWRSPTASYFITPSRPAFAEVEAQWRGSRVGCCVEQTDGLCIVQLRGTRSAELLLRLGAPTCVPEIGESRTSRIADLAVTAIQIREREVFLAVERSYAEHLQRWIESTLADF